MLTRSQLKTNLSDVLRQVFEEALPLPPAELGESTMIGFAAKSALRMEHQHSEITIQFRIGVDNGELVHHLDQVVHIKNTDIVLDGFVGNVATHTTLIQRDLHSQVNNLFDEFVREVADRRRTRLREVAVRRRDRLRRVSARGLTDECSICMGPFDHPVAIRTCGHRFCSDCLDEWEPDTCPMCRADI
jgi:hypothetical protein